jgi:hypothetical protein
MKVYQIIHNVWNRQGRLIINETFHVAFNTESEMNYYMQGKWSMCENNESYIAYELQA